MKTNMIKYSVLDASNDFTSLNNQIASFKQVLCKEKGIDFYSDDKRIIVLDTIQQYLMSATMYIRAFYALRDRIGGDDALLQALDLDFTKQQLEGDSSRPGLIYKFTMESLVVMIHFVIDWHMGKGNWYKKVDSNFNAASREEKYFNNTLQCLGFFRNSFHSNITHQIQGPGSNPIKGQLDRVFECEGFKIEFKHDEIIERNWKILFLLMRESVKSLQYLMLKS